MRLPRWWVFAAGPLVVFMIIGGLELADSLSIDTQISQDHPHYAIDRLRGDYTTSRTETVCSRSWFGLATVHCHDEIVAADGSN